ncbi:hypothetical protein T10_6140 [Trichinella papuae]|uniref:Uncharacterized protein n=1 Tax=Trichinella papuae TaxID=268474 RepID=A0A0V1MZJ5_9BILA|nr:hypothetical protein T10_6140 [Trichinella papuae]
MLQGIVPSKSQHECTIFNTVQTIAVGSFSQLAPPAYSLNRNSSFFFFYDGQAITSPHSVVVGHQLLEKCKILMNWAKNRPVIILSQLIERTPMIFEEDQRSLTLLFLPCCVASFVGMTHAVKRCLISPESSLPAVSRLIPVVLFFCIIFSLVWLIHACCILRGLVFCLTCRPGWMHKQHFLANENKASSCLIVNSANREIRWLCTCKHHHHHATDLC